MRKIVSISVALFALLVVLAACAPAAPPQQFNLRMGVVGTLSSLPYYVMLDQGFDKQNGLVIKETVFQSADPIFKAIANGSLEGSPSGGIISVVLAAQDGTIPDSITAVSANSFADPEHPIIGVVVANSISNWKDLEGQYIGVPSKTTMYAAAVIARLQREGVKKYTLVEFSVSNTGLAIAGGNIAAGVMSEPYLTQSLLRKDGRLLDWIIGGEPFEKMEYTTNVFSTNIVRNNPGAVKAYLRAHMEACRWIEKNPDAARSVLGKKLSLTSEVVSKVKMMRWPSEMRSDPALLEGMQPVLVEAGILKAVIPAGRLYDETLLNEVLSERK
ncbi:MAG: ABC transporter substrate-binding protein [Chloroflexi bacterium]|nr:ABC transporter substrate-binding protein [Chloroflexota bacterium]